MKTLRTAFLSLAVLGTAIPALAETPFVVRDVKIEGLQRIPYATAMNAIKISKGKLLSESESTAVIRDLYKTGFFNYVGLEKQGNTLIVHVMERAIIGDVKVVGNREIPKEQFNNVLKQMGLVNGEVYDRRVLDEMKRELKEVYNAHGKYNATIEVNVKTLPRNRVAIVVTISEGQIATIREIKIIGNKSYSRHALLKEFELTNSNVFTFFTKKDQYAKEKLNASIQALQSFYMDRGYIHMKVDSLVVSLSPDRKHVFITIRINEGDKYTFSGYSINGQTALPKEKLQKFVPIKSGDTFSRTVVTKSVSDMGEALGEQGFGFPKINAEPEINDANKTVFIRFQLEAGEKVYVRQIHFEGNTRTADFVLRHAMRQQESSLLNVSRVKESERQLRLLGYLKNVSVQTVPVPGTNNQVDLNYKIEEGPSTEASVSVGYGTNGVLLQGGYNDHNFMGSGRSVGLNLTRDRFSQDYRISYFNPYFTNTGIGAGFNVFYNRVKADNFGLGYNANRTGGEFNFTKEIDDNNGLFWGVGYTHMKVNILKEPKGIYNKKHELVRYDYPVQSYVNFANRYGNIFNQVLLTSGWTYLGLDKAIFPTKGYTHRLGTTVALPAGSDGLKYYKADYLGQMYVPLGHDFVFGLRGVAAYGNGFGSTRGLPFFENYYAGGAGVVGQIRGFEPYSVGPTGVKLDFDGRPVPVRSKNDVDPIGGNLLLGSSASLYLPYPLSSETIRTSVFFDIGNVYQKHTPDEFLGIASGPPRKSVGVSAVWRSPFGPIEIGYARVLNPRPFDDTTNLVLNLRGG